MLRLSTQIVYFHSIETFIISFISHSPLHVVRSLALPSAISQSALLPSHSVDDDDDDRIESLLGR